MYLFLKNVIFIVLSYQCLTINCITNGNFERDFHQDENKPGKLSIVNIMFLLYENIQRNGFIIDT